MNTILEKLQSEIDHAVSIGKNCAVLTTQETIRRAITAINELDSVNRVYFHELDALRQSEKLLFMMNEHALDGFIFRFSATTFGAVKATAQKVEVTSPYYSAGGSHCAGALKTLLEKMPKKTTKSHV